MISTPKDPHVDQLAAYKELTSIELQQVKSSFKTDFESREKRPESLEDYEASVSEAIRLQQEELDNFNSARNTNIK